MEQVVDTGKDKVQKICERLKKETIEPAMKEAKKIVADAQEKSKDILQKAQAKADGLIAEAEAEIQKRQSVFRASLNQAARQSIEWLKQEIEERLLNRHLAEMIIQSTCQPTVLAQMVDALVTAVANEGLDTDLSALIPSHVEPRQINELIGKNVLEHLKEKSVVIGPKKGGIEVKLHQENVTIDLSDTALVELMTRYVRKDFHKFFFADK